MFEVRWREREKEREGEREREKEKERGREGRDTIRINKEQRAKKIGRVR